MRTFRSIPRKKQQQLVRQFSAIKNPDFEDHHFNYSVRICIFDHWLDREEALELFDNVSAEEQLRRNEIWKSFNKEISQFESYLVKFRGQRLILKEPRSREGLINRLNETICENYQSLIFPELKAFYMQYWDETHLLYFKDDQLIKPLFEKAESVGLHILK